MYTIITQPRIQDGIGNLPDPQTVVPVCGWIETEMGGILFHFTHSVYFHSRTINKQENIELVMQPPVQKASPVPPSVPAATPPQTQSSDYVTSVPPKPEDFVSIYLYLIE